MSRADGRAADEARAMSFETPWCPGAAAGSVLARSGRTTALVRATLDDGVPRWMSGQGRGWLTAEYAMLPAATSRRNAREGRRGTTTDGRSIEIQRLIGRSLRSCCDLKALGERTVTVDCDILQADGGTRTLSFNAAVLALQLGFAGLLERGKIATSPLRFAPAAVSVVLNEAGALLDPDHAEDSAAVADLTVILTAEGELLEVQASGEKAPFPRRRLDEALQIAEKAARAVIAAREACLRTAVARKEEA